MRSKFSQRVAVLLAGSAAVATVATILPLGSIANAAPLPPLAPAAGTVTLAPTSGARTDNFTMTLPAGATCPGDNAAGYTWSTFILPLTADPAVTPYNASGTPTPTSVGFNNLRAAAGGAQVRGQNPGLVDGLLPSVPTLNFSSVSFTGLPAGGYNVGVACVKQDASFVNQVEKYWMTPITITAGVAPAFTYAFGAVPAAPVLGAITPSNGALDVAFTHTASTPATTGYTLTASLSGSVVATANPVAGATTGHLSGLTNGTAYDIALVATNSVGNSSAATGTGTPGVAAHAAPVVTASAVGAGTVDVSWTTPPGTPTGYTLTISPAPQSPEPAVYNLGAGVTSQTVTGLLSSVNYTATVVATYVAPFSGTAGMSGPFQGPPSALIFQEITVERPEGALVLTQRCGVYGALLAEAADAGYPGFPNALSAAPAVGGLGTSPTIAGGGVDPEFGNYPYPSPVTYPTTCGLDLGTATLVTAPGPLLGQYYAADGRLNQVTVVDTRDIDSGWTVNGTMEDFAGVAGGTAVGETFDGDFLGWTPVVSSTSPTQVVTAGTAVAPGTGVTSGTGLTGGKVLAQTAHVAPANGQGIAKLDARIKLLIPATADAGDYAATLSLTVA